MPLPLLSGLCFFQSATNAFRRSLSGTPFAFMDYWDVVMIAFLNLDAPEIIAMAVVVPLFTWSLVWLYRDAERRGQSGLLVALLVHLLCWPGGLLVWLFIRPQRRDSIARSGWRIERWNA